MFRGVTLGLREQRRIAKLIASRPRATRAELARAVCKRFGWQRPNGEPPVRSCTALLARLERMGVLRLPAVRRRRTHRLGRGSGLSDAVALATEPPGAVVLEPTEQLVVRPIVEAERLGWRAYMQRFHYLGDCTLVGECLRYVALLGGQLVALLGWGSASLSNQPRDRHLGWDRAAKARGLHQVVNNVRFLLLPWVRLPNLASRILGANLRRLSQDWEAVYGHRVLLAETFVDTSRFAGTCYRASNWRYLGQTKGYAKRGSQYSFHGRPKAVFVYSLHQRATELLCAQTPSAVAGNGNDQEAGLRTIQCEQLPIEGQNGLFAVLATITDPRMRRGIRHPLQCVLAVAVCATLAGARSFGGLYEWAADQSVELRHRLRCWRGRAPSERTFRRVLKSIDTQQLDSKVGQWLAELCPLPGQALALDGKTLRGSRDGNGRAVHLLAAVVHGSGEVVAQTHVDSKTNEITRVEPLLRELDISGAVVTTDALLTQRAIARHIVEDKKADYVFTVKDNQAELRKDIADLFTLQEQDAKRLQRAGKQSPSTEAFPPSARDGQ